MRATQAAGRPEPGFGPSPTSLPIRKESSSMDWLTDPQVWIALVTLTVLEIVLGIDNIIFISILAGKLRPEEQDKARRVGLALAMITRIALLASLAWVVKLTTT